MGEVVEELKKAVIEYLRKQDDKPYVASSRGSFTTHELAKEIEDETETGVYVLKSLVVLATDQVSRGKKTI